MMWSGDGPIFWVEASTQIIREQAQLRPHFLFLQALARWIWVPLSSADLFPKHRPLPFFLPICSTHFTSNSHHLQQEAAKPAANRWPLVLTGLPPPWSRLIRPRKELDLKVKVGQCVSFRLTLLEDLPTAVFRWKTKGGRGRHMARDTPGERRKGSERREEEVKGGMVL